MKADRDKAGAACDLQRPTEADQQANRQVKIDSFTWLPAVMP